jgi:hypothetical protein
MLVNLLLEQFEDINYTFRKSIAKQILLFIIKYKKVKRSNSKIKSIFKTESIRKRAKLIL